MKDFYTLKSYRENGFIIIKNILNPQEVEEFAEEIKSYFSNIEQKAHNNELVNNRIMPSNVIKYFPQALAIQKNKKLISSISKIFPNKPSYIHSLQLMFNVNFARWHVDFGSQLRHKEYNIDLKEKNYRLAKVGIYLTKVPKGFNLPSISVLKGSHKFPLFLHNLIHVFRFKLPFFTYLLDFLSVDLGRYLNPGDAVIFSSHIWHKSSPQNKLLKKLDKLVFYFEAGEFKTASNYIKHNSGRALFLENFDDIPDIFWCDFLRDGFFKQMKSQIEELDDLGINSTFLTDRNLKKYFDLLFENKLKKLK